MNICDVNKVSNDEEYRSSIPEFLLKKLRRRNIPIILHPKKNYNPQENVSGSPPEQNAVQKIVNNKHMSSLQKEKVCTSILLGEYDISPKQHHESIDSFKSASMASSFDALPHELTKQLAHLKRHNHRSKFLEVGSTAVPIRTVNPMKILSEEKLRLIKKDKDVTYTWAGKSIRDNDNTLMSTKQEGSSHSSSSTTEMKIITELKQSSLSKAIKDAKELVIYFYHLYTYVIISFFYRYEVKQGEIMYRR